MTRRWILPSALLLAAGAGAAGMAIELASLYVSDPSGRIVVAPYALGAVLFLASAWLQRSDERRARLLGIAAAFLVASWVVGVGYGGRELASSAIAVLGVIAALSALTGLSARWLLATLLLFVGAGAALAYVALQHPPLGLVAVVAWV